MSKAKVIDVLILGAGGGGYPAAFFLAKAGLKMVMADPIGNLGGDCLAEGCVPSKALREAALMRGMHRKYESFGLRGVAPSFDWPSVLAHKDRVQNIRYSQHMADIKASGITFHKGNGRLVDTHEAEIVEDSGEIHRYKFSWLIVATGSAPHRLHIPGHEMAITSHELFRLNADLPLPKHMAIIGGGYIGVEAACMLNNLGVDITIVEATETVMPGADDDLRAYLQRQFKNRFQILSEARADKITRNDDGSLTMEYTTPSGTGTVKTDAVLMATGRIPVLPKGIELLGIPTSGAIKVDNTMRTSTPHVYAPGDVNGRSMLFHSAVRQSMVAAHNILAGGQSVDRMNFHSVPATVFTDPELAWVGLDEAAATKAGIDYTVTRYDYETDSRAQIFDAMDGFIKLIFDNETSRLVGCQIAGIEAAQVIAPMALAVEEKCTAHSLTSMVFPHPMITEGINKAARMFQP